MSTKIFKDIPRLLKEAFTELMKSDPMRMGGATAFFTTFALPPILIILIQTLGLVFDRRNISMNLFKKLSGIVGRDSVHQIIGTLRGFRGLAQNWFITIGGFLFLLFVATTLFAIIKNSINEIWKIHTIEKTNLWGSLGNRLRSVFVIFIAGILFLTQLLVESLQILFGNYLGELSPIVASFFNSALSYAISIVIVTAWFAVLFRFLPDGKPSWKVAITGAFVTSVLFNVGKLLLRWLLTHSNIGSLYGASGSIVLLLLFVFYSSLILYYGAAFTKVWSKYKKQPIKPLRHAHNYELSEIA